MLVPFQSCVKTRVVQVWDGFLGECLSNFASHIKPVTSPLRVKLILTRETRQKSRNWSHSNAITFHPYHETLVEHETLRLKFGRVTWRGWWGQVWDGFSGECLSTLSCHLEPVQSVHNPIHTVHTRALGNIHF
jgi:hypothetical protein